MININVKHLTSLLSILAIATATGSLSAQAQTKTEAPTDMAFPGSALTTAETLMGPPPTSPSPEKISQNSSFLQVAQRRRSPETDRRVPDSYFGIGGDIGLGGDTALGNSGFATVGKLGFTNNLSLRTASSSGDGTVLMVSVAYDFIVDREPFEPVIIAPFIGGGAAFHLDGGDVGPMISGGVDYPISKELTATARINVAFIEEETTDVGIILGVAYNFPILIGR